MTDPIQGATELACVNDQRRREIMRRQPEQGASAGVSGLDCIEVDLYDKHGKALLQPILHAYFLGKAPEGAITVENLRIDGGRRIAGRHIRILDADVLRKDDPSLDDELVVTVDKSGDFSTYTLSVLALDDHHRQTDQPFPGMDQRYFKAQFSFKADCPSDLDCKVQQVCPPKTLDVPSIDYLAKDYASFRRLIFDRLAVIAPGWQERHVPDIGVTLVEILAYTGDYLSCQQDAVAAEAYLDTARQRISVRRHVRLVDYPMHEGCNARCWVCVEVTGPLSLDPRDVFFVTGHNAALGTAALVVSEEVLRSTPRSEYEVFEPIGASLALSQNAAQTGAIQLYPAHSRVRFYTWGDRECCLPKGAVSATLLDESQPGAGRSLHLRAGDVIIFEEVIGPKTGSPADADPKRRCAVRLTKVTPAEDKLYNRLVLEIEWGAEDALPFPFCISAIGPAPDCAPISDVSVARGNVVLADHGERLAEEPLGAVEEAESSVQCEGEGRPSEVTVVPKNFRPRLKNAQPTFAEALPSDASASAFLLQDPRRALPQVKLRAVSPVPGDPGSGVWTPQRDLLESSETDKHFVAEMDNNARARLRFGDGELGRRPGPGLAFFATYRIGNGFRGNVGAEAISHIGFRQTVISGGVVRVRNPMAAAGGVDSEPMAEVKLFAPHAFRNVLQRAVTADDYARLAERNPKVQRAAAALQWAGSWYEASVAIDPFGTEEPDPAFLDGIESYLEQYRRMGHDLAVTPARYVSLDIELDICVKPHYLRGHVEAALLDVFSSRALPGGGLGFFHPDALTFGEGVSVSRLIAAAQRVEGVQSAVVKKLQRQFESPNREIENGLLPLGPGEIARLDNDPSFPEHGLLKLNMGGGR